VIEKTGAVAAAVPQPGAVTAAAGPAAGALSAEVAQLRDRFRERYGRAPEGVWGAPGRVNLMGEHTDYNDGFVLPFALDGITLAAIARRRDGIANCCSDDYGSAPATPLATVSPQRPPSGWSAYPLGVAWALAALGAEVPGFDLYISSTVPDAAGVSSSAALESSVALGLAELAGSGIDRKGLALAGRRAENEIAGAPTGVMDQMASLMATAGRALFLDCRSLEARQIPFAPAAQGITVLVLNTMVQHALADGRYGERRRACEEAACLLGVRALRDASPGQVEASRAVLGEVRYRRARHVVSDNERVLETVQLLSDGSVTGVGAVLSASHASLRDDFQVSCAELDTVVEAAVAHGAFGARMIGGGFGGSAIALLPDVQAGQITRAVSAACRDRGFREPAVFAVKPAAGARRMD